MAALVVAGLAAVVGAILLTVRPRAAVPIRVRTSRRK